MTIYDGNTTKTYQTSKENYLEIVSFTTKRYYLHESDLEIPKQDKCYTAQSNTLSGLDENTKQNIQKEIRQLHGALEYTLLDAVRLLKDSNSPYWIRFIEAGIYEEPLYPNTKVERNGELTVYLEKSKNLANKLQNDITKKDFITICNLLEEGIKNHDIEKLFKAHEIIHDYDYWVINTPVHLEYEPADWGGVDTYFGKASVLN